MSGDELRETADLMREQHGPDHPRHEMWAAMADWVDAIGEARQVIDGLAKYQKAEPGRGSDLFLDMEAKALAVAVAYRKATP